MTDYFVVVDVRVDDPDLYLEYQAIAKHAVEKNGGKFLVRGGDFKVVEGEYFQPRRLVLLQFPSEEHFKNWYNSDDYQRAKSIRLPISDMTMIGVEGSGV